MGALSYEVVHRPGKQNVTPDALSRICGSISTEDFELDLGNIHQTSSRNSGAGTTLGQGGKTESAKVGNAK